MQPCYDQHGITIFTGDCLDVMAQMEPESVDSIVTDPPYLLSFMGKEWDKSRGDIPQDELVFRSWFAGLVAGEGYFRIHREKEGAYFACEFGIHMRADESPLLRALAKRTQAGCIRDEPAREGAVRSSPSSRWVVSSRKDCWKIAGLLDGTPLYGKKQREYDIWRKALQVWSDTPKGNRWHGPRDNSAMETLWRELKEVRPFDAELSDSQFNPFGQPDYLFHYRWAKSCLRVAKPGALLLAFGGTRTFHRLTCAIEDAGWEIRDCLMWLYGSGFPKSLDIAKAIDKEAGAERTLRVNERWAERYPNGPGGNLSGGDRSAHFNQAKRIVGNPLLTSDPVTDEAKRWHGWGTALKPAVEPVVVAQKPLANLRPDQASLHRRLTLLEDQLWQLLCARTAAVVSPANLDDDSVLTIAGLPTSTKAALFGQMDTLSFESAIDTSLSIVRSWKSILNASCDLTSMSTTETVTKPTIDWRTLNCCALAITPGDIVQSAMAASGLKCDVSPAVRYFNAAVMNIVATRELSVLADVTWPQPTVCRDETGPGLRPDWRPIVLAMKPLDGTFAQNALRWGVAGLNIVGCRIPVVGETIPTPQSDPANRSGVVGTDMGITHADKERFQAAQRESIRRTQEMGRWPANVILDEESAALLDEQSGVLTSGKMKAGQQRKASKGKGGYHDGFPDEATATGTYGDSGGASRFYYCCKASKREKGPGNDHNTVKPLRLMKYLLTLVATPSGGVVLDPFGGSGTTALAARELGRRCILVELDKHHCDIAVARLEASNN